MSVSNPSTPRYDFHIHMKRFTLPILAGILIGTSYIPFPAWALFFCLIPLMAFCLRAKSLKEALIAGWLTQFILNAIGFHWIAYTVVEYGQMPWPVGILVLLIFCTFAHLHYPLACGVWFWLTRKVRLPIAGQIALWLVLFALIEWHYPFLFHFHLGYPWLWMRWPGIQLADWIGFEGLNILTLVLNGLLMTMILSRRRRAWTLAAVAFVLFAGVNIVGWLRKDQFSQFDSEAHFLMVQGNIGNIEKLSVEQGSNLSRFIVDKYLRLSREGHTHHPEAQIALWPETAYPEYLNPHYRTGQLGQDIESFIRQSGLSVLAGSYSNPSQSPDIYNGLFWLTPQKPDIAPYHKHILLAFGEYVPGGEWLSSFIYKTFPTIGRFGRGAGPEILESQGLKLGPQICYEGLYPWFSIGSAQKGAQILVNVTNDSWFGTYMEPHQHLYMTLARALEVRRPLIRSTNTGISTAILANGDILEKSPQNVDWYGLYRIPYISQPPATLYQKTDGLWTYLLAFALILLLLWGRAKAKAP